MRTRSMIDVGHHALSLSGIATAIVEMARTWSAHWDDLHAFAAPSECYSDERRCQERDALDLFDRWGVDPRKVEEELTARTSTKWMFFRFAGSEVLSAACGKAQERDEAREHWTRTLLSKARFRDRRD